MHATYLRFGLEGLLAGVRPLSWEVVLAWVSVWILENATSKETSVISLLSGFFFNYLRQTHANSLFEELWEWIVSG